MMIKGLFALLMAGSLMVPLITPALGSESTVGLGGARQAPPRAAWDGLPLPPVPHLDTMRWLNSGPALKRPKIDLLLGPELETLGPFLVNPGPISPTQFSSGIRPRETGIASQ